VPDSAEAFYNLGVALKQKDDFAGAEEALRKAIALDAAGQIPEARYTLGVMLWQIGRTDDAVAAIRAALAARKDYAEAHYMLGTVLRQQGHTDEALAELRETVRLQPLSAEAQLSIGQILRQKNDAAGAAAAFAEADRLHKRKADEQAASFAVSAGLAKLAAKDLPGAIASFREAVRLDPDHAQAQYRLGLALQQAGASAEARRHLAEARRLAPYLDSSEPRS
jgi:tetratricopeptide (TPR) repeat protein